jgi:hypothetical protein
MSNIKTINLADHINSAIDKINENFVEVMANAGLTEAEVIALILSEIGKINDDTGFTEAEIRAFLASTTLDLGSNKILYSNVFPTEADLPDASAYHGMFAHVHATGAAYFAHGGQWVELANKSDVGSGGATSLDELSDVEFTTLATGEVLKWDGVRWTNKTDNNTGGGGSGSSTFHATVYTRSETNPNQPTGGSYDFAANDNQGLLTPPPATDVTWYENLPAAVSGDPSKVWACNYRFVDIQSDTDLISGGQWSIPYLIGGTPVDNSGQDQYAQLLAYKRSSTTLSSGDQPSADDGDDVGSFNFDTREYSAPDGWKETPYGSVNDGQLYVIGGISSDADGRIDTSILWSDPLIATTGLNGTSVTEISLYKMVERPDGWEPSDGLNPPDKPEATGTLNFGDNTFTRGDSDSWFSSLNAVYAWGESQDPKIRGDIWSSTYSFLIEGDTGTASVEDPPGWSEPVPEILQSRSTYRASLYMRKSRTYDTNGNIVPPAAIDSGNSVVYSFTSNEFIKTASGNVSGASSTGLWYEEPPALDLDDPKDLWEVSTVASLAGWYGVDGSLTFTDPKLSVNYAIDAENGYSFLQLNLYKWSTADSLTEPANDYAKFNFTNKKLILPTVGSDDDLGWSQVILDNPDENNENYKLYVTTGVASTQPPANSGSDEPLTEDNDISWSIPDQTTAGGAGRDGRSTYLVRIVKKHVVTEDASEPDTPVGGLVNFGQNPVDPASEDPVIDTQLLNTYYLDVNNQIPGNSVVPPKGWWDHVSEIPPSETGTIFESEMTFAINGDTGIDLGGEGWCDPYLDHNNGEDGYSSFSGQIFIRSPEQPNKPIGGSYSFDSDVMSSLPSGSYGTGDDSVDLGNWTEDAPASNSAGDSLWMSRTTATSKDLAGDDTDLTWTIPVKISTDGSSAIVLDLTNENHSITAQNDGTLYNNSLVGASTKLQAFLGDTAIPLTASQVNVSIIGDVVSNDASDGGVQWEEEWGEDGLLTTTITLVGKNVDEVALLFSVPSLNKSTVFSLTKVKAGPNGEPPTVYRLVLSASVVRANSTKTEYTPDTITATVMKYTGGMPPVAANQTDGTTIKRYRNEDSTLSDQSDSGALSYTISNGTTESLFQLYVGDTKVDEETVPVVIEQADPGDITVNIPRTETGYLYYLESSTGAPTPTPSATRFTFTEFVDSADTVVDGYFTGLSPTYSGTSNPKWSISPVGTNLSGDNWAVKFIANESVDDSSGNLLGYSEGSDLMFSPPFQSYSFDGLVTFENTNNIFTEDSDNRTVIDGGKILTNSITADQIDTSTLSITPDWNALDAQSTGSAAGEKVEITSKGMKVYSGLDSDGDSILRVQLGDLSDLPS